MNTTVKKNVKNQLKNSNDNGNNSRNQITAGVQQKGKSRIIDNKNSKQINGAEYGLYCKTYKKIKTMDEKTKQLIQAIEAEIAKIETEKKGVKDSTDLGLLIGRQGGLIDAIHIILQNN